MTIPSLLVAVLLLFLGQRLYWIFVGGIGFIAGLELATRLMAGQSEWMLFAAALLAGIVGAMLAIFFQRLAVGLAGFMAGAYLAQAVLQQLGVPGSSGSELIVSIIGGILVAILAVALLDWALIFISAAVGAALLAQWAVLPSLWRGLVFLGLWTVGVVVQSGLRRGRRRALDDRASA